MNSEPGNAGRYQRIRTRVVGTLVATGLAGCASGSIDNAPAAVAEECRREVADMINTEPAATADDALHDNEGPTETAIEDARTAREELREPPIADWPEDALLYRCLVSRGVALTEEQAATLSEWQDRNAGKSRAPRNPTSRDRR